MKRADDYLKQGNNSPKTARNLAGNLLNPCKSTENGSDGPSGPRGRWFESSHSDVAKTLEIIEVSRVLLFERKDSFQAESSTLVQLALEIQQKNGQITLSGDQARLR